MDIKDFVDIFKALTSFISMICNVLNTLRNNAKK